MKANGFLNGFSKVLIVFVTFFASCNNHQTQKQQHKDTLTASNRMPDQQLIKPLQEGDKIELSGGYENDPLFLKYPPASKRSGTVVQFIQGQNEDPAAVVKMDAAFSGEKIKGDIVVLELRHAGQTWQDSIAVHIELCNFMPENKTWKNRRKGEWIEPAATLTIVRPK